MKRILFALPGVLSFVSAAAAQTTVTLQVLPPTTLVRQAGAPVTEALPFPSAFGGPALVRVVNGSLADTSVEPVSSSVIRLNGSPVFGPSDFNQRVRLLEKTVSLARGGNTLTVELRGKPGGQVSCQILQSVADVRVLPSPLHLGEPGTTGQLAVTGALADGTPVDISAGTHGTTYASDTTSVAVVSDDGLVTAVALGLATIQVTNGAFAALVPVAVKGTSPALSNIQVSRGLFPVPRESEEFVQTLTFEFEDPDANAALLNVALTGPVGEVSRSSDAMPADQSAGSSSRQFTIDSSFAAGQYEIQLELTDAMENSSGVHRLAFSVDPNAPRFLDITGLEPSSGTPGDRIRILGLGFAAGRPSEHRVQFQGPASAPVLSVTPEEIEVVVPPGALAGPVTLRTSSARVLSPAPFVIQPAMAITPATSRLLTGQTLAFAIVESGLRSGAVSCTLNGRTSPGPDLGQLTMVPGGFTYVAPPSVPAENPISARCESQDDPGVHAVAQLEITAPVPPPGQASIAAGPGGSVESVDGTVSLSVPPNALRADTTISVGRLDPASLTLPPDDNYTLAAVRLEPSGIAFAKPLTVTLPLRSWEPPGTEIPVFVLDEATGALTPTGSVATVDTSGVVATASISHFSVLVARRAMTSTEVAVRDAQPEVLQSLTTWFPLFTIDRPPDLPLLEGLSVPVLVRPVVRDTPLPSGPGPFAAPSGLSVTAVMDGAAANDTPAYAGPFVQASPDGWQLGTVVNSGILRSCPAGEHRWGTLTVKYVDVEAGEIASLDVRFRVDCLDELEFDGQTLPTFASGARAAIDAGGAFDHNDVRVQRIEGKYVVTLLWDSQPYRFSTVDVGVGGVLTYGKQVPPLGVAGPFILEVTKDVRVAGTIDLRGSQGRAGDWGAYDCHGCGGDGGGGVYLNSGRGGRGGEFNAVEWTKVPCDQGGYYLIPSDGRWLSVCKGGETGGNAILREGTGGEGGKVWEKKNFLGTLLDIASFIDNAASCVGGAPGACVGAGQDAVSIYGDVDGMIHNSDNFMKAAGWGGYGGSRNAPIDVSSFFTPSAGGGGGGAGYTVVPTIFYKDKAGGGGGSGGGAGANLKLVVGGRFTVEAGGAIEGGGGAGGPGGDGEGGDGAPGGGGGGGSGAAVHLIALNGVINNSAIRGHGGLGGRSGVITDDFGSGVQRALVETAFGSCGQDGTLRVDGGFNGSTPSDMSLYRGPVLSPHVALSTRVGLSFDGTEVRSVDGLTVLMGDFGRTYTILTPPSEFQSSGLKAVSATVRNRFSSNGRIQETDVSLHPWQRAFVFYFPGVIDSDGDGLSDGMEAAYGTNPANPDTDGDGLRDDAEIFVHNTDPLNADTDGDGVSDSAELAAGSLPLDPSSTPEFCDGADNDLDGSVDEGFTDTDRDGQSDCVDLDDDSDGLTDLEEAALGTNPLSSDTDGDGFRDGIEVAAGTDPLDPSSHPALSVRDIDLPEPEAGALFGHAVISIGEDFLVSAPLKDVGGIEDVGRVYLFSGRTRALLQAFDHPGPYRGARFGYAIASIADVTGDGIAEILIGAPFDESAPSGATLGGRAFLFSGADGTLLADFASPEPRRGSHFGMSLEATDGFRWQLGDPGLWGRLRVVIGEPHGGADRAGRTHVFRLGDPAPWTWSLERTLTRPAGSPYAEFGRSVSVAGFLIRTSEAAWGEGAQIAVASAGGVFLFDADDGTPHPWIGPFPGDRVLQIDWFSLDNVAGPARLIADPGYDGTQVDQGAMKLVSPMGSASWFEAVDPVPQPSALFGASTSFVPRFPRRLPDWTSYGVPTLRVVVGAPGQAVGQVSGAGRVFLFGQFGTLDGSIEASRHDPTAVEEAGAGFGSALATIGSDGEGDAVLAIAAPSKDVEGKADQGRVYLFALGEADAVGPVITAFGATPATVPPGAEVTLAYSFVNGTGVVDPSVGPVTSGGATVVTPSATTTYTLTVTSAGGVSVTAEATVVVGLIPEIVAFTADPPAIDAGGSTRLTATFTGGVGRVTPGDIPVESGVGIDVSPTDTTTYVLTVTSPDGTTATASLTVPVYPVETGPWFGIGILELGRFDHTATLLDDGRIVVAGGLGDESEREEVEIYDIASPWSTVVGYTVVRHGHFATATLLQDGKVLIVGGDRAWQEAEVFDPATNQFSMVGPLHFGRYGHTATLLADGRVLIVGGHGGSGSRATLAVSELYDPATARFELSASLAQDRAFHGAALLLDGRVLIVGGERSISSGGDTEWLASAEIFDPATGVFSPTGEMQAARSGLGQIGMPVLSDGTVLVASGSDAELFVPWWDSGKGQFRSAGELITSRMGHTVTLLASSGRVLIAGGYAWDEAQQAFMTVASAEFWDSETRTFAPAPSMLDPRQQHTATPLPGGGQVVVIGGKTRWTSYAGVTWVDLFVMP